VKQIFQILFTLLFLPVSQFPAFSAQHLAATPKKPNSIKKAVPTPIVVPSAPTVVNQSTIDDSGVRYELTSCKRAVESLVCRFLLTNRNKNDVAVSIKANGTRFIDITGEEYLAKAVQIGSHKSDVAAESILIAQVPIRATVTFDAPAANVITLKVLAINHEPGSYLKFREVKIAKSK
jgi:hypothetical protein